LLRVPLLPGKLLPRFGDGQGVVPTVGDEAACLPPAPAVPLKEADEMAESLAKRGGDRARHASATVVGSSLAEASVVVRAVLAEVKDDQGADPNTLIRDTLPTHFTSPAGEERKRTNLPEDCVVSARVWSEDGCVGVAACFGGAARGQPRRGVKVPLWPQI